MPLDFFITSIDTKDTRVKKSIASMTKQRGKLILIEGLDRTGKSTQCSLLAKTLNDATLIKFPDRTTGIGGLINTYLTDEAFALPDQAIHLLFSANRWEQNEMIMGRLLAGENVVLDRYVYSGVAYSAAKSVPGMDRDWCYACDVGLVRPDVTLFLVNHESNENREGFGEERYEKAAFQERVRSEFHALFESLGPRCDEVVTIDVTSRSIEQVQKQVWDAVEPVLNQSTDSSLSTLKHFA